MYVMLLLVTYFVVVSVVATHELQAGCRIYGPELAAIPHYSQLKELYWLYLYHWNIQHCHGLNIKNDE